MGTIIYRPGRAAMFNGQILTGTNGGAFWLALVGPNSTFMDEHPAVMDDFSDLDVLGTDQNLAALSVFEDVPNDRVYIPSDMPPQAPTFLLSKGDIVQGAVLYYKITDYTDSIPLYGFELGTPKTIQVAGNYVFPLPEDGICEIPNFGEKAYLVTRKNMLEGYKQMTSGFMMKLLMATSTYLTDANPGRTDDLTQLGEFDGASYSEQGVSFTINTDADRDRVYLDSPDISFGVMGAGSGAIVGALIYVPLAINLVTHTLAFGLRLNQPFTPDGTTAFSWQFSPDGVAYL